MLQPHILMCPPDYYGIEYEINAWMRRSRPSDRAVAVAQWNALRGLLVDAGAKVSTLTPVSGLPDLVFTANAGFVFRERVVLSRFRHPERQGETEVDRQWFEQHGLQAIEAPSGASFEGAGDALFCGETLYAGYRIRSDARVHQRIGELLGVRVMPLELVDPYFYHLDTCFCPLTQHSAAYYPPAFDSYARQVIAANIDDLIEVAEQEARQFACNAVVVGQRVVTNAGCPRLHAELIERGFEPHATPLDEFVKAGGSAKCLTLRLDGEDAAAWRNA